MCKRGYELCHAEKARKQAYLILHQYQNRFHANQFLLLRNWMPCEVFCLLGICICREQGVLFDLNSTESGRWGSDTTWRKEEKEFPQDSSVMFPIAVSNLPCNDTCPLKKLSQEFKHIHPTEKSFSLKYTMTFNPSTLKANPYCKNVMNNSSNYKKKTKDHTFLRGMYS